MNGSSGLGSLLELEDVVVIREAAKRDEVLVGIAKFAKMITTVAAFIIAWRILTGRR